MVSRHVQTIPIELSLHRHETTTGVAHVVARSLLGRVGRASVALGGAWAVAVLGVFIPILHFFLVPAFLVTGVVLALVRLREGATLVTLEGACPRCRTPRRRENLGRFLDGRTVHCDGCGEQMRLHVRRPAAGSSALEHTNR